MFTIYLIILTTICLYFFIQTGAHKFFKYLVIFLLLHGYLTVGATVSELAGYPTQDDLPSEVEIIWGKASEPKPEIKYPGHIDLWVIHRTSLLESVFRSFSLANQYGTSRIYRIPYSKENHQMLVGIQASIKKGKHVGMVFGKDRGTIDFESAMEKYHMNYQSTVIPK